MIIAGKRAENNKCDVTVKNTSATASIGKKEKNSIVISLQSVTKFRKDRGVGGCLSELASERKRGRYLLQQIPYHHLLQTTAAATTVVY